MEKKILVIYYSQTGQLKDISNHLLSPFEGLQDFSIDYYNIKPVKDFDFPWKSEDFYDAFPESFQQIPIAIQPPPQDILHTDYDLIIIAYQIWFLTPSIPINSFMKSEFASKILSNKKVITVIGCRNMWAKAQQKMKHLVNEAQGQLVGNIAFVDKSPNLISVITIVHWVMGGKKTRKYGIFPLPGVSDEDINNASQYGEIILDAIQNDDYTSLQSRIISAQGVAIKPFIIFMDEKANRMFQIWSNFILKRKRGRKFKLKCFKYYLLTALFLISPIVFIIFILTYPFRLKQIERKNKLYCDIGY